MEKEIKITLIIQKILPKDFSAFQNIVLEALNSHAPLKTKYLRANHSGFISKDLSKAIMYRSKLRNLFLKLQTRASRLKYNKQINLCVTLLRKAKKKYYTGLKLSDINDNNTFLETVKSIFGNKNTGNKTIALEEGNEVITDDGKSALMFNKYFVNIVATLDITSIYENNDDTNNDYIDNLIPKFHGNSSIVAIKEEIKTCSKTESRMLVKTKPLQLLRN